MIMTTQNRFSLVPHKLIRPQKVRWISNLSKSDDPISTIKSSSLRNYLRKSDELLKENNIQIEITQNDKQTYLRWLKFYQINMTELKHDILATKEWFDNKIDNQKNVYIISYIKDNELVGGCIITELDDC